MSAAWPDIMPSARFDPLFGPIFQRELLLVARRKWLHGSRVFYGGLLLASLYAVWNIHFYPGGPPPDRKLLAQFGGNVFTLLTLLQFFAIYFGMPLAVHRVINDERDHGTLDLLLVSPLSDREIILGKLGSRILAVLSILIAGFPALAIILFFGGINPLAVILVAFLSLLWAIYVGAKSIESAVHENTSAMALARSLLRTLFVLVWTLPLLTYLAASSDTLAEVTATALWVAIGVLLFSATNAIGTAIERLRSTNEDVQAKDPLAGPIPRGPDADIELFLWWGDFLTPPNQKALVYRATLVLGIGTISCAFGRAVFSTNPFTMPTVLYFIMLGTFLGCLLAASSNPLFLKRTGMIDLILATPISTRDFFLLLLRASFSWVTSIASLAFVLTSFLVSANPLPILGWFVLTLIYAAYILLTGYLCALVEGGNQRRLWPAYLSLLMLLFLPSWISKDYALPVCVGLVLILFLLAAWQTLDRPWTKPSANVVLLYSFTIFISAHLLVVGICALVNRALVPTIGALPTPLALHDWNGLSILFWLDHVRSAGGLNPLQDVLCYITNLLAAWMTLWGTWKWTERNFDWLTGRIQNHSSRPDGKRDMPFR
ncbi:MAG: ABC transporter permease subunit [Planctomycetota bacterium]